MPPTKRKGTPRPGCRPPNPVKPGEVRNPKGINGWTAARARIKDMLAEEGGDILRMMQRLAKAGDVQAAKLVLGPLLPAQETKTEVEGEIVVRFAREGEK